MAEAANVREWTDLVRRARLGRTTKGIAFLIASYADPDGTRIFPGLATIAVAAEVDYKTAKRALAELVAAGLLAKVAGRSGRRGRSDEYRLVFDHDRLDASTVMRPDEFEKAVEVIRAGQRRSGRNPGTGVGVDRPDAVGDGPSGGPSSTRGRSTADPVLDPSEEGGTGNGVPVFGGGTGNGVPTGRGTAFRSTYSLDLDTSTTEPYGEEVRTGPATSARARPNEDHDSPPLARFCPHKLPARVRPDGSPACALCRRESRKTAPTPAA